MSDLRFIECDNCGARSQAAKDTTAGGYSDRPWGWLTLHFTVAPESPYEASKKAYGRCDFCSHYCAAQWIFRRLPELLDTPTAPHKARSAPSPSTDGPH